MTVVRRERTLLCVSRPPQRTTQYNYKSMYVILKRRMCSVCGKGPESEGCRWSLASAWSLHGSMDGVFLLVWLCPPVPASPPMASAWRRRCRRKAMHSDRDEATEAVGPAQQVETDKSQAPALADIEVEYTPWTSAHHRHAAQFRQSAVRTTPAVRLHATQYLDRTAPSRADALTHASPWARSA